MRWAATGFLLALVAVGLALAFWQWGRAAEKQAIQDRLSAALSVPSVPLQGLPMAEVVDRRAYRLEGRWLPEAVLYLDNRALEGRPGVHVVVPLQLPDGRIAWVNLGWLPKAPGQADPDRSAFILGQRGLPDRPSANIEALALSDPLRRIALGSQTNEGALWQNFPEDWGLAWLAARGAQAAPDQIYPAIFWLSPESEGAKAPSTAELNDSTELPRALRPSLPENAANTHRGYALQWLLMSLAAAVFAFRLRPAAT